MAIDHWPSGGDFVDGDHHIFGGGSRVVIENNNFDICRNILLRQNAGHHQGYPVRAAKRWNDHRYFRFHEIPPSVIC